MQSTRDLPIAIIGAGLTGCFLAILLARRGYRVAVYEQNPRPSTTDCASRRSFSLTFNTFGQELLAQHGLWDELEPHSLRLDGFMTHIAASPKPIFESRESHIPTYTIQRATLLKVLQRRAEQYANVIFHYDSSLVDIGPNCHAIRIKNHVTHTVEPVVVQAVLGADGVNSVVRREISGGKNQSNTQYADWNYKQIILSNDTCAMLGLLPNVTYTWSAKDAIIALHPDRHGMSDALLVLPDHPRLGFARLTTPQAIQDMITLKFPALLPALPVITEALLKNPRGRFVTVRTASWHRGGFAAILGDAAHGMYPFLGQGVSAGFGDARALTELLDQHGTDWSLVLPQYEKTRKRHMDALAELSRRYFLLYQRHSRASFSIINEKAEALLHRILPRLVYPPLTDMIANSPCQTADHLAKHKRLKIIAIFVGLPIFSSLVWCAIKIQETIARWRANNRSMARV